MQEWREGRLVVLVSEAGSVRRRTLQVEFPAARVGGTVHASVSAAIDGELPQAWALTAQVSESPWEYAWNLLSAAWLPEVQAVCTTPRWVLISASVPDLASQNTADHLLVQLARPANSASVHSSRVGLPPMRVEVGQLLTDRSTVSDALNILYELLTGRSD